MNALIAAILVILAAIIAIKLLGLAFKLIGILIVVALAIGAYAYAQRVLKGQGRA